MVAERKENPTLLTVYYSIIAERWRKATHEFLSETHTTARKCWEMKNLCPLHTSEKAKAVLEQILWLR